MNARPPPTTPLLPGRRFPGPRQAGRRDRRRRGAGDEHAVTAALRNALCRLIRDRDVQLPDCVHDPILDHYARRELYRSPTTATASSR